MKPKIFDLYGANTSNGAELAASIGEVLNVQFARCESDFRGECWFGRVGVSGEISIVDNDLDGDLQYEEHAEFDTIVELDDCAELNLAPMSLDGVCGLTFLERTEVKKNGRMCIYASVDGVLALKKEIVVSRD